MTSTGPAFFGSSTPPAPAWRYWRLYVTANYASGFTVLSELNLLVSGVEPTYTGTATETGGIGSQSNAFDNNPGTQWLSFSLPSSVGFDFGAGNEKAVTSFGLLADSANYGHSPESFTLQGSADGSAWTTYATYTSEPAWSSSEYRTYAFN